MGLGDVAGVFSRYFIVGYFLPAFVALVVLWQTLTDNALPTAFADLKSDGAKIAVIGGCALVAGLLLLALNYQLIRIFEGYPIQRIGRYKVLKLIPKWLIGRREKALNKLIQVRFDPARPVADRAHAAWSLDRCYPGGNPLDLLPTRFGCAVKAFELHSLGRYGLDAIGLWPRVEYGLSDHESEVLADAKSEVAFLINLSLLSLLIDCWLIPDAIAHRSYGVVVSIVAYGAPLVLAYVFYRWAVGAAMRWGSAVRAAIDLHRLEVYKKIGVRMPTSASDERGIVGPAVSRMLLYGRPLPDDLFGITPTPDTNGGSDD